MARTPGNTEKRTFIPAVERLEDRCMLAAEFRTFDGADNNLAHPFWGSVNSELLRKSPAAYADRIASPAGASRPSARAISNAVMAETHEVLNERLMSDFVYVFGQFLDHDLSLTPNAQPSAPLHIPVPVGDPFFDPTGTGTQVIRMNRSQFDPTSGTSRRNPREQISVVSAWLDGSQIYGSSATRAAALRTGVGGELKTSEGNMLPYNTLGLSNQIPFGADPTQFFVAGDIRANENIELTSMHVLWLREHNRIAAQISAASPGLSDEQVFQEARQRVIAELQVITYKEFLPALLGSKAIRPYAGYKPRVNPSIANEFSTVGFRVGHTFLGDDVEFLDDNGHEIRPEVPLSEAFFNPELVVETDIGPILKYLSADKAREGDTVLVNGVRNFLFGPPGAGGFDLGALDIQRARDHGLADYNSMRKAYRLPKVRKFEQITSDPVLQATLKGLYGSVKNIDPFVGGLAEKRAPGASVGPLFQRIIADQFQRLRDGDRFWYQRVFSGAALAELEQTTLSSVIRRNSPLQNIQDNVFFFDVTVRGQVFFDIDSDGVKDSAEFGIPTVGVMLLDEHGDAFAVTRTRPDGTYEFVGRIDGPGHYQVQLSLPLGWELTSVNPYEIDVTRGEVYTDMVFGLFSEDPTALELLGPHVAFPRVGR